MRRLFYWLALLLLLQEPAQARVKRPMEVDDLFRLRRVSSPQISPDGQWIVYTISRTLLSENRRVTHLYRVSFSGGDTLQLTRGKYSEWGPQWRPDGKMIGFLSNRSGRSQIWVMNPFYGEPGQLTDVKTGVREWRWSHDGRKIAFTMADSLTREEERRRRAGDDARIVDEDFRMVHLYVLDVATKKIRRLTRGNFTVSQPRWSIDDRFIYFVRRPTPKPDDRSKADIMMVPADSGAVRPIAATEGAETSPLPSPDGQWVAFAYSPGPGSWIGPAKLYLVPAFGGEPQPVETDFDRTIVPQEWSPDSRFIYFSTVDGVRSNLYRIDISTGRVENISQDENVLSSFSFSRDRQRVAFLLQKPDRPVEVYSSSLENFAPKRLTFSNPWLKNVKLGRTVVARWRSKDGTPVEGLLVLPEGEPPFPTIVGIHGGPSGVYTRSFLCSWATYPHILTGKGFAVFLPNFRGSSGYGTKFQRADIRDWGQGDFEDIMSGLDSLVAAGIADSQRLGVMGWSYGGYMTFWTVTQTHRFRAASAGAGLTEIFSMYSQNDIPSVLEAYFGAHPWSDPEEYWRASPLSYVKNVQTPLLILQGERDVRVPRFQAMQFYTALRQMGKKTRFVLFPRQGHGIGEPKLQKRKVEEELAWFERYVLRRPGKPEGQRLTVDMALNLASVSSPHLSPDGQTVLYAVSRWDRDHRKRISQIYRLGGKTSGPVQLTRFAEGARMPRWSPDGKWFAFLGRTDGKEQVFLMNPFFGEADQVTDWKEGVVRYAWSPDGTALALVLRDTLTEEESRRKKAGEDAIVWEETEQKQHLWMLDLSTRKLRRLTRGDFNVLDAAWSPDGKAIAYTRASFRVAEELSRSELWVLELSTGKQRRLLPGEVGFRSPAWSPDGRWLAVINTRGPEIGDILRKPNIFLVQPDGSAWKNLTADYPGDIVEFAWTEGGRTLICLADEKTSTFVVRFRIDESSWQRLSPPGAVRRSLSLSANGQILAFTRSDPQRPPEVCRATLEPYREQLLSHEHPELDAIALATVEAISWEAEDGLTIEGLLVKPLGYEKGLLYPTVVMPHGGPAGHYSLRFHSLAQLLAAEGYLVLLPNVRGSTAYGEDFLRANIGDLGGKDFQDLMAGLNVLIKNGMADPERLGIWGWSYGGYMAAWAVTQTRRFQAAVVGAAVTDWFSVYGHDDIQYDVEEYFRGLPYEQKTLVHERSPMWHVKNVQTPVLILHGERDFRDPLPQAQNFYLALKKRGIPVEFVIYPREGHGIREYYHRKDMLERSIRWFDRYLYGKKSTVSESRQTGTEVRKAG